MKSKVYLYQMEVFIIWIFVVTMLFRFVPSKQVAGAIAGFGFVLWPFLFLIYEWKQVERHKFYIFILSLFLVTMALPIFLLRILNWESDFSDLSLLGIPAQGFHKASNVLYLAMVATSAVMYFKTRKIEKGHH